MSERNIKAGDPAPSVAETTLGRPLRVALIVLRFPVANETPIIRHLEGLLARGVDAQVFCDRSSPHEWQRFPELKERTRGRVHPTRSKVRRYLAPLIAPAVMLRALGRNPKGTRRYLRRGRAQFGWSFISRFYFDADLVAFKPDVVHFEFGYNALRSIYLKELLGCRAVSSFRGSDANFEGLADPRYFAQVWAQTDAFHFLGADLRRRVLERGCPPDTPFRLIAPSVNASRFAQFEPGEQTRAGELGSVARPLRVLSVGRLVWKKGHEYMLQAVRLLQDAGLHCEVRIIGRGEFREAIEFARRDLNLENCVELLGVRPHHEIAEHMAWADVLVHASVSEGFCNAVLEAQAAGVPVVCSDADGLSENVADGITGFVVPRRDPHALAAKIRELACDGTLRQQLGEAGRNRARQHFAPAREIDGFLALYALALRGGEAPLDNEATRAS